MDIFETQNHLNNLKDAKESYRKSASYFNEVADLFDNLIVKLQVGLQKDLSILKDNTDTNAKRLKGQSLETRKIFIESNNFNEYDISNLSSLLSKYIANNVPTLELFPGSGQFLPFNVSAEPFYIADRYYDICVNAAKSLNNEFYANRRLRKYEIPDNDMSSLPQQSFGIVYCFNEFIGANEDYIIDISKQVRGLLYDGGTWVFNFLPNDKVWAQKANIENNLSVIDYNYVINELTKIGFVLENFEIKPLKSSYMVWRKSGDLQPRYKIGGGVAEIIDL
jgi:hypothetical protein